MQIIQNIVNVDLKEFPVEILLHNVKAELAEIEKEKQETFISSPNV